MRPIAIVFIVTLFIATLFAGCGKRQGQYGNFAKIQSIDLADDAVEILVACYPPAQTRLALVQATEDGFGSALVEKMRVRGYGIAEYAAPARKHKYLPAAPKPEGPIFAYTLDDRDGELRVVLHIGAEMVSRLYLVRGSSDTPLYIPQGAWTRKQNSISSIKTETRTVISSWKFGRAVHE